MKKHSTYLINNTTYAKKNQNEMLLCTSTRLRKKILKSESTKCQENLEHWEFFYTAGVNNIIIYLAINSSS